MKVSFIAMNAMNNSMVCSDGPFVELQHSPGDGNKPLQDHSRSEISFLLQQEQT